MNIDDLIDNVIDWGRAKSLHDTSDLKPQLAKLMEELGEVAAGVARDDKYRIVDGIGDMLVVMINFGAVFESRYGAYGKADDFLRMCLNHAWSEIENRKGKTVGGVFVKEFDGLMP